MLVVSASPERLCARRRTQRELLRGRLFQPPTGPTPRFASEFDREADVRPPEIEFVEREPGILKVGHLQPEGLVIPKVAPYAEMGAEEPDDAAPDIEREVVGGDARRIGDH